MHHYQTSAERSGGGQSHKRHSSGGADQTISHQSDDRHPGVWRTEIDRMGRRCGDPNVAGVGAGKIMNNIWSLLRMRLHNEIDQLIAL